MTTAHRLREDRYLMAVKGSPAAVLDLCDWHACDGRVLRLGEGDRREILAANAKMAGNGWRVLAAACVETDTPSTDARLVWLGLVGLADPPRQGLRELMEGFHRAGVRPLMLTGDQAATATAVAEALALNGGREADGGARFRTGRHGAGGNCAPGAPRLRVFPRHARRKSCRLCARCRAKGILSP